MPDAYAVRISAQVAFVIVRLTPEETLTQNLWGSKFDGPAVGWSDWLVVRVIIVSSARDTYEQLASRLCEPKLSDRLCCERRLEMSAVRESRIPQPRSEWFRSGIAAGLYPTPHRTGSSDTEIDQRERDTPVGLGSAAPRPSQQTSRSRAADGRRVRIDLLLSTPKSGGSFGLPWLG